ncbi:MAG: hypothetical protein WC619_01865 [Patescibacteria group bacterium]
MRKLVLLFVLIIAAILFCFVSAFAGADQSDKKLNEKSLSGGNSTITTMPPVKYDSDNIHIIPRTSSGIIGSSTVDSNWKTSTSTEFCLTGDGCRTTWPTGSIGLSNWTFDNNYGVSNLTPSSSIPVWVKDDIHASSSVDVAATTTTKNLEVSNNFKLSTITGFLKATAGYISNALIDLTSDITGILPEANGGTGTTSPYGILKGDGTDILTAVADTDYQVPLTFGDGLTRTLNDIDCDTASAGAFGCLTAANWTTFNNKQNSFSNISELNSFFAGESVASSTGNTNIVKVGTLTTGATGAGFTINLDASSLTCTDCIDISGNTNLTAGDFITLTDDDLDIDTGAIASGATTILATAGSIYDFVNTATSSLNSLYQSLDTDLTAIAGLSSAGFISRTGSATYSERTLATSSPKIIILNPAGIAGNPTFDIKANSLTIGVDVKAGTLTNAKYCTWDSANSQMVCNSDGGGSGSGTVNYGEAGSLAYYSSAGTTATGTPVAKLKWDNTNGRLGIGTSTPFTALSIVGTSTLTQTGGAPLVIQNLNDGVSNQLAIFKANKRTTPADNDQGYLSFYGDDDTGTQVEFGRMLWEMDDVTNTTKDATIRFMPIVDNGLTDADSVSIVADGAKVYLIIAGTTHTTGMELDVPGGDVFVGRTLNLGAATVGTGQSFFVNAEGKTSTTDVLHTIKGASTQFNSVFGGMTIGTLTANNAFSKLLIASESVTEGSSGNHPLLSQLAIKPFTITAGTATVSDTASLYIEGAATTTVVSGQNYALWVDNLNGDSGSVSRLDGTVLLSTDSYNTGIGTTSPMSKLSITTTGNQLTLAYNNTNYTNITTNSSGQLTIDSTGNLISTTDAVDFGGASYFKAPYSANPTVDAAGKIALDTTTGSSTSIHIFTDAEHALFSDFDKSVNISSTTIDKDIKSFDTGTSTFALWNPSRGVVLNKLYCKTDTGTATCQCGDGTNWTELVACSATPTADTSLSNNSFITREDVQCRCGTQASDPNKITITGTFEYKP